MPKIFYETNEIVQIYDYDGGSGGSITIKKVYYDTALVFDKSIPSELFQAEGMSSADMYDNSLSGVQIPYESVMIWNVGYTEINIGFLYHDGSSWQTGWFIIDETGMFMQMIGTMTVELLYMDNGDGTSEFSLSYYDPLSPSFPPLIAIITAL